METRKCLSYFKLCVLFISLSFCSVTSANLNEEDNENKMDSGLQELCDGFMKTMDPFAHNYILKIINQIQADMLVGVPLLNIPPLDPLFIPKLDFKLNNPQYQFNGNLSKIIVTNLSSFKVTEIQTNLKKLSANISIRVPHIFIKGVYDAKGRVMNFIPIYGKGPFLIKAEEVTTTVFTIVGLKEGRFYVKSLDFQLDMKRLRARFEGIMGGGRMISHVYNEIINSMGLTLFYQMEPLLHNRLRAVIINEINKSLMGLKFKAKIPCRF